MSVLDYSAEIEAAINKYANQKDEDVKNDIRQTAYLALLEAGEGVSLKKARKIIQNSVVQWKQGEKGIYTESLSEPYIFRKAEAGPSLGEISSHPENENLRNYIEQLPEIDARILSTSFGIYGEHKTERELAKELKKSPVWVHRRKELALEKLSKLM